MGELVVKELWWRCCRGVTKHRGDSRASIHPSPAPCPLQAAQHSKSGLPLAQLKTPAQGNTQLPATEGRLPAVAKKEGTPAWHPTEKEALCSAASQGARPFPPLYHRDF